MMGQDNVGGFKGEGRRITIRNNLFYDIDDRWGKGNGRLFQIYHNVEDVTIDHNTAIQSDHFIIFDGERSPRTTITNNVAPLNTYGIMGVGKGSGISALNYYSPGWVMLKNAFVGGSAAKYGTTNYYPASLAAIGFMNPGGENYRLSPGSPYQNIATDGKDLGADVGAVETVTGNVIIP
jgi:hypothetical protein